MKKREAILPGNLLYIFILQGGSIQGRLECPRTHSTHFLRREQRQRQERELPPGEMSGTRACSVAEQGEERLHL